MCTRMGALSQIPAAGVQRPWLPRGLPELLDTDSQTADDVAAGERSLHGRRRQTTFKIIKYSAGCDAGNDLQPAKLRVAHHQHRMIRIGESAVQPFRVRPGILLRDADEQ